MKTGKIYSYIFNQFTPLSRLSEEIYNKRIISG